MNQNYQLQACPRCGSVNLEPGYQNARSLRGLLFGSPLLRLLKALLSGKTSAFWVCRDCGCKFPMKDR